MRILRRSLLPLGAIVLLGLATALVLLALDVRAWQRVLGSDDVRFRVTPAHGLLWRSPATLPGDPASAILGLDDALELRHALQSFWHNEVGVARSHGNDLSAARLATQASLQALATGARTAVERSDAADLLGVMTITTTSTDKATLNDILNRSAYYFQLAITDDPGNWGAKVNLEIVLRLKRPGKSHFGADARGGFGFGGSEGKGIVGGGF
jgi:hypothetical protein